MFIFILLSATTCLVITGFILIIYDFVSNKRHQNKDQYERFPKFTRYSVISVLIALILVVFVSISFY